LSFFSILSKHCEERAHRKREIPNDKIDFEKREPMKVNIPSFLLLALLSPAGVFARRYGRDDGHFLLRHLQGNGDEGEPPRPLKVGDEFETHISNTEDSIVPPIISDGGTKQNFKIKPRDGAS